MDLRERVRSLIVYGLESKHIKVTLNDLQDLVIQKLCKLSDDDLEIIYHSHDKEIESFPMAFKKFNVDMTWCNTVRKKSELAFSLTAVFIAKPYFETESVYLDELIVKMITDKSNE